MRTWDRPDEPDDVELIRDASGQLFQRCRDCFWETVDEYQQAGLPKVGGYRWTDVLEYGPLTEVEVPE